MGFGGRHGFVNLKWPEPGRSLQYLLQYVTLPGSRKRGSGYRAILPETRMKPGISGDLAYIMSVLGFRGSPPIGSQIHVPDPSTHSTRMYVRTVVTRGWPAEADGWYA